MTLQRRSVHWRSSAPEDGTQASAKHLQQSETFRSGCLLQTTASWLRAALGLVPATPCLLRHRPAVLPIPEAGVAIIGWLRRPATAPARATLAMMTTTPGLLGYTPTCLPIGETILTTVRIWNWRRQGRRVRRAAQVMNSAAPGLLACAPLPLGVHGAIPWINWSWGRTGRTWCGHWHTRTRRGHRRCLNGDYLRRRKRRRIVCRPSVPRGGTRQQEPKQQRNQQQNSQETATGNDASEVSGTTLHEVATIANVPVCGFLPM